MGWTELGGPSAAAIVLAVISGLLLLFVLIAGRSRAAGKSAGRMAAADPAELADMVALVRDELGQLGHEMNGRLDAKMRALRELLRQAEAAIGELRGLTGVASRSTSAPARPQRSAAPCDASATAGRHAESADVLARRYGRIYDLADRGLAPPQIAAETGMHRGEIDLVLGLRRKQHHLSRVDRTEPDHSESAQHEEAEV